MKITRQAEVAGRQKTEKRTALEKANIAELMKTSSVIEISEMFDVHRSMVYHALRSQSKVKEIVPKNLAEEFSTEDYYNSQGAWMQSKERKSFNEL